MTRDHLREKHKVRLAKQEEQKKRLVELELDAMIKEGTAGKPKTVEVSMCTIDYVKNMMYIVDSLCSWQMPLETNYPKIPVLDPEFIKTYDQLYNLVCESVLHATADTFFRDCERWIISARVVPAERLIYRTFHATGARFSHLNVCQSVRDIEQVKLKNFHIQVLDTMLAEKTHPYHIEVLNYATWWTIVQLFNDINPDTTLIHWEFETDYLTLTRQESFPVDVIVRIGTEFCYKPKGSWVKPGTDTLDLLWGTSNLLQAVTYWLLQCKAGGVYRLWDRKNQHFINVKETQLINHFLHPKV